MKSNLIFDVIGMIASTASKNAKEAIIKHHSVDEDFKKVLVAAYDPFVTYGIGEKSLPDKPIEHVFDPEQQFDDTTWQILDLLAKRKLTGNYAREAVMNELTRLSPRSSLLFKRILCKDLRAGFSESTINKAIPGLVPTFDCMLAHKYADHKRKLKFPLYAEPKLDGVRVLTFVTESEVRFFSRAGKEFSTFDHLKEPVKRMVSEWLAAHPENLKLDSSWVIDSEVVSGSFNKTVSEVRRKDDQALDAKIYIFDILPMQTFRGGTKEGCKLAGDYTSRRIRLKSLFNYAKKEDPIRLLPRFVVTKEAEIHALYEEMRANGLEGLIIKDPKGLYHRRRNHAWAKIKAEESVDVPIVDAFEGEGKYVGMLGGLVVNYNGVRVSVGGGFTDEQRKQFWYAWLNVSGDPEFDLCRSMMEGRLIEVQYHEVTPDGSLRHPRFIRFRDDKQKEVKE